MYKITLKWKKTLNDNSLQRSRWSRLSKVEMDLKEREFEISAAIIFDLPTSEFASGKNFSNHRVPLN